MGRNSITSASPVSKNFKTKKINTFLIIKILTFLGWEEYTSFACIPPYFILIDWIFILIYFYIKFKPYLNKYHYRPKQETSCWHSRSAMLGNVLPRSVLLMNNNNNNNNVLSINHFADSNVTTRSLF